MWLGDKPVCPNCWGQDVAYFDVTDWRGQRQWLCCNPDCLCCYFDPDDPDDQPSKVSLMVDTVISQDGVFNPSIPQEGRASTTGDA